MAVNQVKKVIKGLENIIDAEILLKIERNEM